jgi:hypothetical protein
MYNGHDCVSANIKPRKLGRLAFSDFSTTVIVISDKFIDKLSLQDS